MMNGERNRTRARRPKTVFLHGCPQRGHLRLLPLVELLRQEGAAIEPNRTPLPI